MRASYDGKRRSGPVVVSVRDAITGQDLMEEGGGVVLVERGCVNSELWTPVKREVG
jgi:hypothetical protein